MYNETLSIVDSSVIFQSIRSIIRDVFHVDFLLLDAIIIHCKLFFAFGNFRVRVYLFESGEQDILQNFVFTVYAIER